MSVIHLPTTQSPAEQLADALATIERIRAELAAVERDRDKLRVALEREVAESRKPWTNSHRDPWSEGELSMIGIDAVVENPSDAHHLAVVQIPKDDLSRLIEHASCRDCDEFHGWEHVL